jgi:dipeptidyl aminopeptidase/acylaminoacyl peptidase
VYKKIILILLAIGCAASAGIKVAGAPIKLAGDEITPFSSPLWSPDGGSIALTSPDYAGIWLMSADGSELRQITDARGAGFGLQWSPDGRALAARVSQLNGTRLRHALKLFDLDLMRDTLITPYRTGRIGLPQWSEDGRQLFAFMNGRMERMETGMLTATLQRQTPQSLCLLDVDRICTLAPTAAEPISIRSLADQSLLTLVHSADGIRVAFQILGGPLCVMHSDGTGLIELGPGEWPSFSPDGTHLTFMITEDDGHVITGSDIYVIAIDGTGRTNLTNSKGRSEMHPSWSPLGDAILFDLQETGEIWKLPITVTLPEN